MDLAPGSSRNTTSEHINPGEVRSAFFAGLFDETDNEVGGVLAEHELQVLGRVPWDLR